MCMSWPPISGHRGVCVAAVAVQLQPWAPGAGGPSQKLQEGDILLHPLTVGHWELEQWLQGEMFALELEKEQLRSNVKSKGSKWAAKIQQYLVRWRRWWPVPHSWLSVALCHGWTICASSVLVALNKRHKRRNSCCQALPVAEGRCSAWLKTPGGTRAVEQWHVSMVTATYLWICWSSANVQPAQQHSCWWGVTDTPPSTGKFSCLTGNQGSPAWLEKAGWQPLKQTI